MRAGRATWHFIPRWALAATVFLISSSACAETASVLTFSFGSLADSRDNQMESCGFQFSAGIQKLDGSLYVVNGSVNTVYVRDRIPSVLIKVLGRAVSNGQAVPMNITSARVRIGTDDTSHFKQARGMDPGSILLMQTDADLTMKWPELTSRLHEGFWLTLVGDKISNVTFKIGPFADDDFGLVKEYADCQVAAIRKMQKWLTE